MRFRDKTIDRSKNLDNQPGWSDNDAFTNVQFTNVPIYPFRLVKIVFKVGARVYGLSRNRLQVKSEKGGGEK